MAMASVALLLLLGRCVAAAPSSAVEREIGALEPELSALLELSINGAEKGAAYNRTADFCDFWGHRISGSQNLEDSIDSLAPMLRAEGLSNVHYEPAMVPHWVSPLRPGSLLLCLCCCFRSQQSYRRSGAKRVWRCFHHASGVVNSRSLSPRSAAASERTVFRSSPQL